MKNRPIGRFFHCFFIIFQARLVFLLGLLAQLAHRLAVIFLDAIQTDGTQRQTLTQPTPTPRTK